MSNSIEVTDVTCTESIDLSQQNEFILSDSNKIFEVTDGVCLIYLVKVNSNGETTGKRELIFNCREGNIIIGAEYEVNGYCYTLMATSLDNGKLALKQNLDENSGISDTTLIAINIWCDRLCSFMFDNNPTEYAERCNEAGTLDISSGNSFRPHSAGLFFINIEAGSLLAYGISDFIIDKDSPLISTGDVWLEVLQDVKGKLKKLDSLPDSNQMLVWKAVKNLTGFYLQAVCQREKTKENVEKGRLDKILNIKDRLDQQSIDSLKFNDTKSSATIEIRETPLLTCLDVISSETGIKIDTDSPPGTKLSLAEQLNILMRGSGSRTRKVKLEDDWWNYDAGTLLAFSEEGDPIVLISVRKQMGMSGHYEILDPLSGRRRELDPDLDIKKIDDKAYSFLRPLPQEGKNSSSFLKLAKFNILPFLTDIRLLLILALASGIIGAALPIAKRMMVDDVIPDANRSLLYDLGIGLCIMSFGTFLFSMSQGLVSLRMKTAMTNQMQSAIIDRLLRLPAKFFKKYSSGDMLNRSMMISEISSGFSMTTMSAVFSLLSTFLMLLVTMYYSVKFAILAVIAALLTTIISISFSYVIRKKALDLEVKSGKHLGVVYQLIAGVTKLRTAGASVRAFNQWAKEYGQQLKIGYKISYLTHYSGQINTVIQTTSTIALYYFAGKMVEASEQLRLSSPMAPPLLTIGVFFAVQGAFSGVVGGVCGFFGNFLTIHQLFAKRELVNPILQEPIESGKGKIDPGRLAGHIDIKELSFRYEPNAPLVLKGINLKVEPSSFVAIVGGSGSGKTTLLNLLLGFETPESGQILFDKKDSKDLDMVSVRRQTGVVLQDGKVNAGTIHQNSGGAAEISMDDAWESARAAGMDDDISEMPMGMHTLIPEGGTTLSGGQKQRLLIARSLAQKPRILFFDEATSALDNRTQEIVTKSLEERRITRIVVAHRLSTIKDADIIYVFEDGRIVESGKFDQLIANNNVFKEMVKNQLD